MSFTDSSTVKVVVVYALSDQQRDVPVELAAGDSVESAIRSSGLLQEFPEIDLERNKVGIYGTLSSLSDPVYDGARVEIYRPLKIDPKESRRRRLQTRENHDAG
jgi:putative ubiquitin-RnfH superfamily antitoxin RatB of RatAB toxin-antitoxin module